MAQQMHVLSLTIVLLGLENLHAVLGAPLGSVAFHLIVSLL